MTASTLVTVPEAARVLRVHANTIRRWITNGTLRASKVGGKYRIDPAEFDRLFGVAEHLLLPKPDERFLLVGSFRDGLLQLDAVRDDDVEIAFGLTEEEVEAALARLVEMYRGGGVST
jgi:excisionase family DNA binding protein